MAITFTSGLEPRQTNRKSFRSTLESERRAAEFLQGTGGFFNPLEIEIIYASGIFSLTLAAAGSDYMSAPTISFVNRGSYPGTGAVATTALSGNTIGSVTLSNVGTGYTLAPNVVITGNEIWTTFTDDDINFTTNTITKTEHGMSDDDRVHLTTDNILPIGLYTTDTYGNINANPSFYVVNVTTDTFQLSLTPEVDDVGTAIDILTARPLSEQRYAEGTATTTTAVYSEEATNLMVIGIQVKGGGQFYTTVPTVTISAPPSGGTQATAIAVLKDDRVDKITMVERGKGYTSTPTVTISGGHGTHTIRKGGGASITTTIGSGATGAPTTNATGVITDLTMLTSGGGTGATATASLTGNNVTSLSITAGGSGYTSIPTVVFDNTGTGGSNATATATVTNGVITGLAVVNQGSGYTSAPTITFFGGGSYVAPTVIIDGAGGSGATATATLLNGAVNDVTLTNNGTSYTSLISLVNHLITVQINLTAETTGSNTDETQINAWIAGTPPSNWTNAGYTDANLTSINSAIDAYQTELTSCQSSISSILTNINTSTGAFRQHNERLCGLQAAGTSPFVPDYQHLMITARRIMRLYDELGIPYENFLLKLMGTLFTGSDTINTAIGNILAPATAPWSGTPYDMGTYDVQSVISAGATTPSAIITVINGFATSVTAYNVLLTADNAAFTAHKTNDEAEYAAANLREAQIGDGQKHIGWWTDPFYKFMYTNVIGSRKTNDIIAHIDDETIT